MSDGRVIPFPAKRPAPPPRTRESLTERAKRLLGERDAPPPSDGPEAA